MSNPNTSIRSVETNYLIFQELEAGLAEAAGAAAEKDAELADAAEVAEVLTDELERLQAAAGSDAEQHQRQARSARALLYAASRLTKLPYTTLSMYNLARRAAFRNSPAGERKAAEILRHLART